MRPPAAAFPLALLLVAGCATPVPSDEPEAGPHAFDSVGAPWAFVLGGGCGFCVGQAGPDQPSDWFALAVFADGHAVRVDANGGWGEDAVHVGDGITFDQATIRDVLARTERGRGEVWVVAVHTAIVGDAGTVEALHSLWDPDAPDEMCTDTGYDIARRAPDGEVGHVRYSCGPRDGPMAELSRTLAELAEGVARDGSHQGAPAP